MGFWANLKTTLKPIVDKKHPASYAIHAFGLGIAFGWACGLVFFSRFYDLGALILFLSFFHFTEFIFVALFHLDKLSTDSFLITHSYEFSIAIFASFTEYFVEWFLFPSLKGNFFVLLIGCLVAGFGQLIRLIALYTAGRNFTHMVSEKKEKDHVLVTSGIYSIFRHPGYFGWFWWAVGTQIVVGNPICIVGYTVVSWMFFDDRIRDEEEYLRSFFGQEYVNYRINTRTWIPFIR